MRRTRLSDSKSSDSETQKQILSWTVGSEEDDQERRLVRRTRAGSSWRLNGIVQIHDVTQSVFLAKQRKRCFANKQYGCQPCPQFSPSQLRLSHRVSGDLLTCAVCFRLNESLSDSDERNLCLHHRVTLIRDYVVYEAWWKLRLTGRLTKETTLTSTTLMTIDTTQML